LSEVEAKQSGQQADQKLSFDDVILRCQPDMQAVDQVIHQRLSSDVALVN